RNVELLSVHEPRSRRVGETRRRRRTGLEGAVSGRRIFVVPMLVAALSTGCAGARTRVVAPTANVPVSFTRGVRDEAGALVPAGRREVVGHFHDERTAWGLLYSAVKLTPTKDVSEEINDAVAHDRGDAIVNLRMETRGCTSNFAVVLTILPFWPGCTHVI